MSWKEKIKKERDWRAVKPNPGKRVTKLTRHTDDMYKILKTIRRNLIKLSKKHYSHIDEETDFDFFNEEIQKLKEKLEDIFEDM